MSMKSVAVPVLVAVLFAVAVVAVPITPRESSSGRSVETKVFIGQVPGDFLLGDATTSTMMAAAAAVKKNDTHYEDPYADDCQTGEVNITIVGVAGAICSPACGVLDSCPKDVPKGVVAKPACALQDMTGRKFCALMCAAPGEGIKDQKLADSICGEAASCKAISNVGICTYDE